MTSEPTPQLEVVDAVVEVVDVLEPFDLPPAVPDEVVDAIAVDLEKPLRLSPDGMRALQKATGRTLTDLLQDDADEAARIQVMAFADLYRRYARLGHLPDAAQIWAQAGRAYVEFTAPASTADPLGDESSTTSRPSAGTGG